MIWRHLQWFHAGLEATRTYFYYSNRMIDFNNNLVVTTCEFCKNNFDFLEKGLCRTTSFIDATSDWSLALTTFMTLTYRAAAAPCFAEMCAMFRDLFWRCGRFTRASWYPAKFVGNSNASTCSLLTWPRPTTRDWMYEGTKFVLLFYR